MPFPSTKVIPEGWGRHNGAVSENAMPITVSVILGTTNPDDWQNPGEPIYGYQGVARLTYAVGTRGAQASAADQDIWGHNVTIAIPRQSGGVPAPKQVRVDATNGPPDLVGRVLTVTTSSYSSYTFEQLLSCVDDQSNQPGGA